MRGTVGSLGNPSGPALAATAIAIALTLAPSLARAAPCDNSPDWADAHDVAKLKPGQFVVKARLAEAFRSETPVNLITGNSWGLIYFVKVEEVVGGPGAADDKIKGMLGKSVYVHLPAAICGTSVSAHFQAGDVKLLVLQKKDDTGVFEVVGGGE